MDLKREWFEKNLDHDVEPDEPKGWTKRRLLTIPGCCDESKILVTVVLGLSGNDIYENDKGQSIAEACEKEREKQVKVLLDKYKAAREAEKAERAWDEDGMPLAS